MLMCSAARLSSGEVAATSDHPSPHSADLRSLTKNSKADIQCEMMQCISINLVAQQLQCIQCTVYVVFSEKNLSVS
jgi:hypothetical protein